MAELAYLDVGDATEAILKADPRLAGYHVTQEFDPPTAYPWVAIDFPSVDRDATYLTAGIQGGGAPDTVNARLTITAMCVSVQSARDARRQAMEAARILVDVLRANYTLGGTVLTHQVDRIDFARQDGEDAVRQTMYAAAKLTLTAVAIS
jgi:hypothetical protein